MPPHKLDTSDWESAKRIFTEALARPTAERASYLDANCAGKKALRREVEELLANHSQEDAFFDVPHLKNDALIGKRIGAYCVLRAIGQGGMGIVYLAERADGEFRRRVALKAVKPEYLDDQTRRRFENERRMLAVLDHPHIVKLLDGGTTEEGIPFLVMDYVEGSSILTYCETRKLALAERLRIFREVLGAVHYAHQNLVVHRDLKPSNILVTPGGTPKLLDFGIAKLLRPEYLGGPIGLTRTSAQPLTPEFASPEQMLGQPLTTATDIYSLGVILYRLLTGHHPFEQKSGSLVELERAICETDPERPSSITAARSKEAAAAARLLRGDLDNIVLMAMRKEPQCRYASAEHFSEDIRRYLEGFPVKARPAGPWYRASKFVSRHRAAVALTLALNAGMIASAALAFHEMRIAQQRFKDIHNFASFAIFLDDRLRQDQLAPVRQELNAKALSYLDGLAKEAGSDPALRRELYEGYLHAGDVAGNPNYSSNLGDMAAAETNYRKAQTLAQALVLQQPGDVTARIALAKARIKLADVLWPRGKYDPALELYRQAAQDAENTLAVDPGNKEALTMNFRVWDKMMSVNENRGDIAAAVESAGHCLKYAEALRNPALRAYVEERKGTLLVYQGDAVAGERAIRRAIAAYEALGHPSAGSGPRRNLAKATKSLGDAQRANGDMRGAEQSYRRSIEDLTQLASKDSRSASYPVDLGEAHSALIGLLLSQGDRKQARMETARALTVLRPHAENATADESRIYNYAWLLVTTPFSDLRDDASAIRLARRMDRMDPNDPEVLDVLARATARNGDAVAALELEKRARAGLARPAIRTRIEEEIRTLSASGQARQSIPARP